jgi:hypothetical protein
MPLTYDLGQLLRSYDHPKNHGHTEQHTRHHDQHAQPDHPARQYQHVENETICLVVGTGCARGYAAFLPWPWAF